MNDLLPKLASIFFTRSIVTASTEFVYVAKKMQGLLTSHGYNFECTTYHTQGVSIYPHRSPAESATHPGSAVWGPSLVWSTVFLRPLCCKWLLWGGSTRAVPEVRPEPAHSGRGWSTPLLPAGPTGLSDWARGFSRIWKDASVSGLWSTRPFCTVPRSQQRQPSIWQLTMDGVEGGPTTINYLWKFYEDHSWKVTSTTVQDDGRWWISQLCEERLMYFMLALVTSLQIKYNPRNRSR